jgi:transposase InsO family protein
MSERVFFINEYLSGSRTITDLAKEFGISITLAYKFLRRYQEYGISGLEDLSTRPNFSPNKTSKRIENAILKFREKHKRYGAEKIHTILSEQKPNINWPAISTIHIILKRNNMIPQHKRIRRIESVNPIFDPTAPNQLWSADYKGKFRTGDHCYIYPLTIADSFSRFLFAAQGLINPTFEETKSVFIKTFRKFGLPEQLHTDNGSPFAGPTALARLSCFAVWLIEHLVDPVYSDPGCPSQNGRHERMHRELKAEAARPPAANLMLEQKKLNAFIKEYNTFRPHQALGNKTPASVHIRSLREYSDKVTPWDYPKEFFVRRVFKNGAIRWGTDHWIMVATPLIGRDIGLEELGNGIWRVYFRNKLLGYLDERTFRIQDIKGRSIRSKKV